MVFYGFLILLLLGSYFN